MEIGNSVCLDGVTPDLSVSYINGTGSASYQWYSSADPSAPLPWTAISGATGATYSPPTDVVGTLYYYVVITFDGSGGCSEITSDVVSIEVLPQVTTINTPSVEDICVGGIAQDLFVDHTVGAGNVSYQWYSNSTNSNTGGTLISGATSDTYTPDPVPFGVVGSYYYYVEIDYDAAGCDPAISGVYTVNVVADPTVTIAPLGPLSYCQGATAEALVSTSGGGLGAVFSYQWYENTTNNNTTGSAIGGATGSSYVPSTATVGVIST